MSLENQVSRVSKGTKDTLKTLINKLGGNVTDELIDQYPAIASALDTVDPAGSAQQALNDAKSYTDQKISEIPTPDVSGQIGTHNSDSSAHSDIRELVSGLTTRLNALADSDDTTLDQLSEIVAYIKNNKSLIDGITTSKVNVADIIDNLTTNVTNKPLSAAQGVALKALIDAKSDASSIIEQNKGLPQKFWRGTQAEYDAVETKSDDTMYIITDDEGIVEAPGDMQSSVYDTLNKQTDIFQYADQKIANTEKGAANGVATLGADGKVPFSQLPEISAIKTFTATIGTTWTENADTGVKSQSIAIAGVLAKHTAKVDHAYTGDGTSDGYAAFVEAENQYLTCITNGYAETYNGGITFHIFGDAPTVSIPIVVEVA